MRISTSRMAWFMTTLALATGLLAIGPAPTSGDDTKPAAPAGAAAAKHVRSAAYEWLDIALEATAREHDRISPRPTVGSRMLAIVVTAMYDAWAAYDDKAIGTRLGGKLRRPAGER